MCLSLSVHLSVSVLPISDTYEIPQGYGAIQLSSPQAVISNRVAPVQHRAQISLTFLLIVLITFVHFSVQYLFCQAQRVVDGGMAGREHATAATARKDLRPRVHDDQAALVRQRRSSPSRTSPEALRVRMPFAPIASATLAKSGFLAISRQRGRSPPPAVRYSTKSSDPLTATDRDGETSAPPASRRSRETEHRETCAVAAHGDRLSARTTPIARRTRSPRHWP